MTNRHAFSLVLASLAGIILLMATCANPGSGTPSTYTLPATPDTGYVFDTWEGYISGTSGTYIATMTGNLAVTARFIPDSASQPPELVGLGCVQDDTGTAYTLTGGYGGATVVVSTLADLQTCLTSASPYTVIVNGLITSGSGTISTSITVASNKTIYGAIPDGILDSGSPVSDGVNSRHTADLYIQGNFFLNLKNTVFTSDGSGTYNLADNLAANCTNVLPASTSGWTPGYNWTADAAAVIQAGDPTSWAGVGIMTGLP